MKQQKRKGFTLVELLVVIAILAILATVSIVGYTQFLKKANISNDTALATQINNVLLADETVDGKPGSLGGALEVVKENGFDVKKLTPTADGHDFVYDVENNRFALLDKNGKEVYVATDRKLSANLTDRWVIRADEKAARPEGYSVYFQNYVAELTLNKLIGVEGNIGKLTINDTTAKADEAPAPVVIAGDIETLIVSAPNGVVRHYNDVRNLEIQSVREDSWHEYGKVGYATIADGRFVAEAKAEVFAVVATGASVKVEDSSKAIKNAYTTVEGATFVGTTATQIESSQLEEIKHDSEASFSAAIKVGDKFYLDMEDMCNNGKGFKHALEKNGNGYVFEGNFTIEILKDIKDKGLIVASGSNLTIDLNGHTWDIIGTVGSTNTTTNALQFLKDSNITLKNGTIKSTVALRMIQNYANLTLENILVDATDNRKMDLAVSLNNGVSNIIGNTSIKTYEGNSGLAFAWTMSYPNGTQVTVDTTGEIDGDVSLGAWAASDVANQDSCKSTLTIKNGKFNGAFDYTDGFTDETLKKAVKLCGGSFANYDWEEVHREKLYSASRNNMTQDQLYETLCKYMDSYGFTSVEKSTTDPDIVIGIYHKDAGNSYNTWKNYIGEGYQAKFIDNNATVQIIGK